MLRRHVARALLALWPRLLMMGLICAITFAMIGGAYSAIHGLFATVGNIQQSARMADLELMVMPEDMKNLPDFDSLAAVESWQPRLLMPGRVRTDSGAPVAALFAGSEPGHPAPFNRLRILQGEPLAGGNPNLVVVERDCARHHGLGEGDRLRLRVGEADYELVVGGVALSPEYLIAPLNPGVYVPAKGSLCVLFGDWQLMHRALGFRAFNSLLFDLSPGDPGLHKASVVDAANRRLAVDYALTRDEQFSQRFLRLHLTTFDVFLPAVVAVFAGAALLVVMFLMYQWVMRERPLIGLLLLLGYGPHRLRRYYLLLPLLALLAFTLVAGTPLAWLSQWAFATGYARGVGMPEPVLALAPLPLALSFAVVAGAAAAGMWWPTRAILRMSPLDVFQRSRKSPAPGTFVLRLASRIGGPFWFKYGLRNLLRSTGVSLVCVAAIAAMLAVTTAFYVSGSSMEKSIVRALENDGWQAVVDFDVPLWGDEMTRLTGIVEGGRWSGFVKGGVQLASSRGADSAHLVGADMAAGARQPLLLAGRYPAGDAEEVVMEQRLAVNHGLAPGDTVNLSARGELHRLRLVGVHSSGVPGELIAPLPVAARMLGLEERFSGAFLLGAGLDFQAKADLLALADVHQVMTKREVVAAVLSISEHIWTVVHVAAAMSIAVTALFLMAGMTFTITRREGEYGALKLQGFGNGVVTRIVVTEVAALVALAVLVALPLTWLMAELLNSRLSGVWLKVYTLPAWRDFARVLVPALLFMPLAVVPALVAVLRKPLLAWTRERSAG